MLQSMKKHSELQPVNKLLFQSSTSLQKLQLLNISVVALQKEIADGEFDCNRIIAELLMHIKQELTTLIIFKANPYVANLESKVLAIEDDLQRKVQWIFREIGPLMSSDDAGMIYKNVYSCAVFNSDR